MQPNFHFPIRQDKKRNIRGFDLNAERIGKLLCKAISIAGLLAGAT